MQARTRRSAPMLPRTLMRFEAGPPICGPLAVMHDGDNDDLLRTGAVDQRIRKALEPASANVLPDLRPQLRKITNGPCRRHGLIKEFVAQPWNFCIVILDGISQRLSATALSN
jgi:hypothetical protein